MFLKIVNKLWELTALRYLFSGGLSYAIELSFLYTLIYIVGFSSAVAVTISFWVGFAVAFSIQKLLAFRSKDRSRKTVSRQLILYGLLVLFNYTFTLFFVIALENVAHIFIARTSALIITTAWNYFLYSKVLFK